MDKIDLPERPDWRDEAEKLGFTFADMGGEPYWDETSAYRFTLREIEEDIEDPSTQLHAMCREAVERDARIGERRNIDRRAVQGDLVHLARDEVDERRGAVGGGETHDRARAEHLGAGRQVEGDVVALGRDERAAVLRFEAGEVLSRHCDSPVGCGLRFRL